MEKEYRLKGCMSSKGYEKIKDGDIVPAGWFSEADFAKMLEKGKIVEVPKDKLPEATPDMHSQQSLEESFEEKDLDSNEAEVPKDKKIKKR